MKKIIGLEVDCSTDPPTERYVEYWVEEGSFGLVQLTPEQLRQQAKRDRDIAVLNIKVTTSANNTYDGDETAQSRMARTIIALQATGTEFVTWVLADNTIIQATAAELTEALALAGAAQAKLWII